MKGQSNPIVSAGVAGLVDLYRTRALTPEEAVGAVLDRIERLNPGLNAVVALDADAGAQAAAASARWRAGAPLSPIDGAPIVVKANIAVAGLPWTAAIPAWRDRLARADAFVVARLREAGAVILGLANMHEGAFGMTNDGPLYGKAFNPLRAGHTPGGSSGGSAAAVAAGLAAGALGTDTLGSVRVPSAYCGIVGFKPSFGRLSCQGVVPLAFSLDCVGLHARSVTDVRLLFAAVDRFDPSDPASFARADSTNAGDVSLNGLVVGVVAQEDTTEIDEGVRAAFETGLAQLVARGARVMRVTLEGYDPDAAVEAGVVLCQAEGAFGLAEAALTDGGMSAGLRRLLDAGARMPSRAVVDAADCARRARVSARKAFAACDVLVSPTAPQTAFPHAHGPQLNQADFTALASLAGLPAVTIPLPVAGDGLPAGLMIMTPHGADERALALAARMEDAVD